MADFVLGCTEQMSSRIRETELAAFKQGLKEFYGADIYHSYFDPLMVGPCNETCATLVAKNRYAADRISSSYGDDVHAIWCERVWPVECLEVKEEYGVPSYIRPVPDRRAAALMAPARGLQAAVSVPISHMEAVTAPDEMDAAPVENLNGTVNPDQTLVNFCVNETNRMAMMAVERLVDGSGAQVTYIYGNNGYGKSHLLNAACTEYDARFPGRRIMFLTYESLVADVSDAVVSNSVKELRAHLDHTDLLVFDDVQLLRGRKRTQEELACLIERFQRRGKPVLVAGTMSPEELNETGIAPRLSHRLGGGASVRIGHPDATLRLQIATRWAKTFRERMGTEVSERHLNFIARRCDVSVREFQGVLEYFELAIMAREPGQEMTDDWVRTALGEKLAKQVVRTTLEDIFVYTAHTFGVTSAEMRSTSRRRALVRTRQAFCLAARKLTDESLKAIGGMIGRDHTTVMHSVSQAEIFAASDKDFGQKINKIFENFGS